MLTPLTRKSTRSAWAFGALLVALFQAVLQGATDRPNILVIITDDQRWDMLGVVNPVLHTPEMDRLATEGIRFENAFVTTSICAASRASILTGHYERSHRYTFLTPPLANRFALSSYPALLKAGDYKTGYVGKFGVSTNGGVTDQMFHDFIEVDRSPYWKEYPDGSRRHATDITADRVIELLDAYGDDPFCLTIGFNAPHADDLDPLQYLWPPSADHLYEDYRPELPATGEPEFYNNLHPYLRDGTMNRDRWQWRFNFGPKRRSMTIGYYRMISGVDAAMGRIREALARNGQEDNTIIMLIGDNGYFLGERGYAGKWMPHEPSIRVPLLIFDPRDTRSPQKSGDPAALALNIDLAPTIVELAGLPVPESMQGRSLKPFIHGDTPSNWRTDFLVEHLMMNPSIRKHEGVRNERWKYARYFEALPVFEELYDLQNDPLETTNLINNPQVRPIADALRERTEELIDRYGGPFSSRLWREPR